MKQDEGMIINGDIIPGKWFLNSCLKPIIPILLEKESFIRLPTRPGLLGSTGQQIMKPVLPASTSSSDNNNKWFHSASSYSTNNSSATL